MFINLRVNKQCLQQAIIRDTQFVLVTDINTCICCGLCVANCFYDARKKTGKLMTVEEVMKVI